MDKNIPKQPCPNAPKLGTVRADMLEVSPIDESKFSEELYAPDSSPIILTRTPNNATMDESPLQTSWSEIGEFMLVIRPRSLSNPEKATQDREFEHRSAALSETKIKRSETDTVGKNTAQIPTTNSSAKTPNSTLSYSK